MNCKNAWIGIPLSLLAGLTVLAGQNALRRRLVEHPTARLSRQDILNRTSVLKQISLLPAATRDTVSQDETRYRYGRIKLLWTVDCWELPRGYAGRAQWDDETGELRILSRKPSQSQFTLPDISRGEAIAAVWRLLKQPGIGKAGEQWQLTDSPIRTASGWHLDIVSEKRRGYVQIDSHTGQVTYLRLLDRPADSRTSVAEKNALQ